MWDEVTNPGRFSRIGSPKQLALNKKGLPEGHPLMTISMSYNYMNARPILKFK